MTAGIRPAGPVAREGRRIRPAGRSPWLVSPGSGARLGATPRSPGSGARPGLRAPPVGRPHHDAAREGGCGFVGSFRASGRGSDHRSALLGGWGCRARARLPGPPMAPTRRPRPRPPVRGPDPVRARRRRTASGSPRRPAGRPHPGRPGQRPPRGREPVRAERRRPALPPMPPQAPAPPRGRRVRVVREGARETTPRGYVQFGPLSAYPRALRTRFVPALPSRRSAVITCIATTAGHAGAELAAMPSSRLRRPRLARVRRGGGVPEVGPARATSAATPGFWGARVRRSPGRAVPGDAPGARGGQEVRQRPGAATHGCGLWRPSSLPPRRQRPGPTPPQRQRPAARPAPALRPECVAAPRRTVTDGPLRVLPASSPQGGDQAKAFIDAVRTRRSCRRGRRLAVVVDAGFRLGVVARLSRRLLRRSSGLARLVQRGLRPGRRRRGARVGVGADGVGRRAPGALPPTWIEGVGVCSPGCGASRQRCGLRPCRPRRQRARRGLAARSGP
jgi:hypothetical protein